MSEKRRNQSTSNAHTPQQAIATTTNCWLGIDLGAANIRFGAVEPSSCCLNSDEPVVNIFANIDGKFYVPTFFCLKKGRRNFGSPALETSAANIIGDATAVSFHRKDVKDRAVETMTWYADAQNGRYHLQDEENAIDLSTIEVVAAFLTYIRELAVENLSASNNQTGKRCGKSIDNTPSADVRISAVIVVPSFSGQIHRQSVLQAAQIAGFSSAELISQSTAVATAYRHKFVEQVRTEAPQTVGTFSVGAQTTEFSIFSFECGQVKMLASDGYTNFGGAQFTNALMRCCINEKIGREEFNALPVNTKRQVLKAIWQACEEAKIELSYSEDTRIAFTIPQLDNVELCLTINRVEFESLLCSRQIKKLSKLIDNVAARWQTSFDGAIPLQFVVLAGQSSRIHRIRTLLKEKFPGVKLISPSSLVPEEAAVRGAALKAAYKAFRQGGKPVPQAISHTMMPEFAYRQILLRFTSGNIDICVEPNFVLPICQRWLPPLPQGVTLICSEDGNLITSHTCQRAQEKRIMYRVTTNGLFISCDSNGNQLRLTEVTPFLMTAEEIATAFEHEKEYIKSRQQQQKGVVLLSTPKGEKVLSTPKREKVLSTPKREKVLSTPKREIEIAETPQSASTTTSSGQKRRGRKRVYEDRLPINFTFSDNRAQKDVYVMGSWDNWKDAIPLKKYKTKYGGNFFQATGRFAPGQYQYHYRVNDEWRVNVKRPKTLDGKYNVISLGQQTPPNGNAIDSADEFDTPNSKEEEKRTPTLKGSVKRTRGSAAKKVQMTLSYYKNDGAEAFVMGSWDDWKEQTPLKQYETQAGYRYFQACKRVTPGYYEYRFNVDGEWKVSPRRPKTDDGNNNYIEL